MAVGKQITILSNGYNLACALQQFEPTGEAEVQDATVLCSSYKEFEQGFKNGTVNATGVWKHDPTTLAEIHNVMSAAFEDAVDIVLTSSLELIAHGGTAMLMDVFSKKYGINQPLGQLITVSLELQSNNAISFGHWLFNALVEAGTANGASVDNGASSSRGGLFHAHLHNDTATDVTVRLQHSIDNSVWADLAVIVTEPDAEERLGRSATIAKGVTINRYTRVQVTVAGGDTTIVSAAFARRYLG